MAGGCYWSELILELEKQLQGAGESVTLLINMDNTSNTELGVQDPGIMPSSPTLGS